MYTLIKGGNIFDVEKGYYIEGDILINGSKIEKVGHTINDVKINQVIDGYGKNIFPGFIDAHSHIGMWTYTHNGNDANECVDPVTPEMRAIDGINSKDPCFQEAVESGITTVMATPGSGNVIGGMAAILKTHGTTMSEAIIKEYAALKIALGENPKTVYHNIGKTPSTRMATAALLEENFIKAKMYFNERHNKNIEEDYRWEVFSPVFKREIPLKIHAHRADDILTAIRIAEKYNLRYTLDHCTEGYLIVDELKKKNKPILLGPLFMFKSKTELKNASSKTAQILSNAGCNVSLISDHPFTNGKYLLAMAGFLVKEGLDYAEAIRMVTINPARALEVDDQIGSIKEGKDADIVLCDGDPLEVQTRICMTIINGKIAHSIDSQYIGER
ncbi:amidohydrolase [Natronincola ferrireducens]|uniref:Imidazolonepropionase n=1 Tax=Natronincola ferrireducens TaxID=393762 RepID=A0A1G9E4Y7_9FIRM|nr:amidohydrolase [Natronincola ferrireducens]SDK71117.1 Imidazolonepropionase [Natronincola ferrireducens]